ncbi:hypothetical protein H2201_009313, partial [Coniosporium apollinis]
SSSRTPSGPTNAGAGTRTARSPARSPASIRVASCTSRTALRTWVASISTSGTGLPTDSGSWVMGRVCGTRMVWAIWRITWNTSRC